MTETLCDSGSVKIEAGANVSTAITGAQYTEMINKAEAFLSAQARYDFVTNYSSLPTNLKPFLKEGAAAHAAFQAIKYNQSVYGSKQEAQVMLDGCWSKVVEVVNLLRDSKFLEFIKRGVDT